MRNRIRVGQKFMKADNSRLVFEVENITGGTEQRPPQAKCFQVEEPEIKRLYSVAALADVQHFLPV